MTAFVLPQLRCPFEPRIHPQHAAARRHIHKWCVRHGLVAAQTGPAMLDHIGVVEFVARAYPTVEFQRLLVVLDWTVWAFFADDSADEPGATKEVESRFDEHLAVLRGDVLVPDFAKSWPLVELRTRILEAGGESCLQRFVPAVDAFFSATLWEAQNRARGVVPSIEDYLLVREFDVGMYTEFALFQASHGVTDVDRLWAMPELQALMRTTSNIIAMSNDIFSFNKERAAGDCHNIVDLIAREKGCSLQRAAAEVAQMHDDEVTKFLRLEGLLAARVRSCTTTLAFIDLLKAWIRSNMDWSLASGRYGLAKRSRSSRIDEAAYGPSLRC